MGVFWCKKCRDQGHVTVHWKGFTRAWEEACPIKYCYAARLYRKDPMSEPERKYMESVIQPGGRIPDNERPRL